MSWIARISECLDRGAGGFGVEALATVLPLEWVQEALEAGGSQTRRTRRLPGPMTVWVIILLALFRRLSYLNLLGMLKGGRWAARYWSDGPPPCTRALTKARDRVGVKPLALLYRRSAREWGHADGGLYFHGRRVQAIDGFTLKTWDSAENRKRFGTPGATRGKSAFPQVRVVGCLDVGTRLLRAVRFGSYRTGEIPLADAMRPDLEPGSLVLMDRHYAANGLLWDLRQQDVDFIVRVRRNMRVRRLEKLDAGDWVVTVSIPPYLRRRRPELPARWLLREVTIKRRGIKQPLRLFTSVLDPSITGNEIAALYPRRWDEEIAIDEVKTHLGEAANVSRPLILRSRTPARVQQELYGLFTAYNAVRRLMADTASAVTESSEPVDPLRLSFTSTLERVREAIRDMMRLPIHLLLDRFAELREGILRVRVVPRPGRSCPRAVRIKMSPYPVNRRRRAG